MVQEIGEGLQRSEMVTEEQWAWLVQGAAAWEAGSQSLRAAWHETCIQVGWFPLCSPHHMYRIEPAVVMQRR